LKPDEYHAWNHIAEASFQLKMYEKAKTSFKKVLKIGTECDCALKNLIKIFKVLFLKEGLKGNHEIAIKNLKELLNVMKQSDNKILIYNFFVTALKNMVKKNKTDLIRLTLKEIKSANQGELLELLSPFATLIKYVDTKDLDIIERLRKVDRKIVEEMLKEMEKHKI
jgi:tetratricopeptide (TPR) repeat protein